MRLDEPWSRSRPARIIRELLLRVVFGSIITTYARTRHAGAERVRALDGPVIFVANHCSHVDTPVLLRALPASVRRRTAVAAAADYFYARRRLAAAVSLAFGTVPLERRATTTVLPFRELIDGGWSVVIFAEGTRSRDGRVGPLRSGAALLAAEYGVPIVPVHIGGTHRAMPPGRRWMVRPAGGGRRARHTIRVSFGAPITVVSARDRCEAMERVRLFMAACGAETTPDPKLAARRAAVAAAAARRAAQAARAAEAARRAAEAAQAARRAAEAARSAPVASRDPG